MFPPSTWGARRTTSTIFSYRLPFGCGDTITVLVLAWIRFVAVELAKGEEGDDQIVLIKDTAYHGGFGRMGLQRGEISSTTQPAATVGDTDAHGTRETNGRPGNRNFGAGISNTQCPTAEDTNGTSIQPTGKEEVCLETEPALDQLS